MFRQILALFKANPDKHLHLFRLREYYSLTLQAFPSDFKETWVLVETILELFIIVNPRETKGTQLLEKLT